MIRQQKLDESVGKAKDLSSPAVTTTTADIDWGVDNEDWGVDTDDWGSEEAQVRLCNVIMLHLQAQFSGPKNYILLV